MAFRHRHRRALPLHSPLGSSGPRFCLIQAVGLVVSCHGEKNRKKMPLDWPSLAAAHGRNTPAWSTDLTACDVMAPAQVTPSNGTTCCQGIYYASSSCNMYVTLVKNITEPRQRQKKESEDEKKKTPQRLPGIPPVQFVGAKA